MSKGTQQYCQCQYTLGVDLWVEIKKDHKNPRKLGFLADTLSAIYLILVIIISML